MAEFEGEGEERGGCRAGSGSVGVRVGGLQCLDDCGGHCHGPRKGREIGLQSCSSCGCLVGLLKLAASSYKLASNNVSDCKMTNNQIVGTGERIYAKRSFIIPVVPRQFHRAIAVEW